MKSAVIGSAGQLGRDLVPRLPGEVVALTREQIDLSKPETVRPCLDTLRPDVVFNCAAYNFVDKAETEPQNAFATNAWGVRELAVACASLGCLLVHFSTDYVFGLNGMRSGPYSEEDAPGPVSQYGISKLAGEYVVRTLCPRHLVLRTCGLYGVWGSGGKGGNFVETMLRVAGQGKPLRVVADQYCTPSYTVDVAAGAVSLAQAGQTGLFHLTNSGSCSWHEFAKAIFELAGLTPSLSAIPTSEYPLPARRPPFRVLSLEKLSQAGVAKPRPWREALAAYLLERAKK